ncbi:hypothetical protein [Kordiimonas sp.]|uniref:hypothetical protein n=1 Tax=Kordiimonas sp. TaxID=1970157 RepID=UPI003A92C02F
MPNLKNSVVLPREVEADSNVDQSDFANGGEPSRLFNPDELLSRRAVEAEYGITVKQLERAAWTGDGPPMVKFGHRTVRYRRRDIIRYIAAHLVGKA